MKLIQQYIFNLFQFFILFFSKKKEKKPNVIYLGFNGNDKKICLDEASRVNQNIWFSQEDIKYHIASFGRTGQGMSDCDFQKISSVIYFKGNPSWEKLFQYFNKNRNDILYHSEFKNIIKIIKQYKKELYINDIYPSKYYNITPQVFINEITSFNIKIKSNKEIKKVFNNTDHQMYSHKFYDIYSLYIKEDKDLNLITSFLKKQINKTKNSSELLLLLTSHLNKINDFDYNIMKKELNEHNIDIVSDLNSVIIIKTKSFLEMQKFGVNSWCIQSNENDYNYYVAENNDQFIIYDFNRLRVEKESIIGVTMNIDKNCVYSFDAYDNKIDIINDYFLEIMK